jgi:tetratricopeptide (TPR) repeat protein
MTEEITAALAKVPDLRVVARTSAFEFKGQNRNIQSIGQQLKATHLIEGSVRKAGDRVRITVQLINADDGTHLWSENYERQLTDVFAIQEDIARTVTASFNMSLDLKPGENLVNNRDIDPASYEQYLRGKAEVLKGRGAFAQQIAIFEPLVERNPRYSPAWIGLAQAYNFAFQYYAITATLGVERADLLRQRDSYHEKMQAAADRAVELAPESVEALVVQGFQQVIDGKLATGEELYTKALAIDPNNPFALAPYANMLIGVGRVKDALRLYRQLVGLEPFVPLYAGNFAEALWLDGQTDAAIAIYKDHLGRTGAGAGLDLARVYASLGQYSEAADTLAQFPPVIRAAAPIAAQLLRTAPTKVSDPQALPRLGNFGFVYLHIGAAERALEFYEDGRRGGLDIGLFWHPSYAAIRNTERFKKIVRDTGVVDYWRAKGWPEFCRPVGADDFVCE